MTFNRFFLALALVSALAVSGCGKDEAGTGTTGTAKTVAAPVTTAVTDDLGSLVPADAALLLYVPSPADLEKKFQQIVGLFDAEAAEEAAITYMLKQQIGPIGEYWDTSKPMALAVGMPPEGAPIDAAMGGAVMILPVTDSAKAAATFDGAPPGQAPTVRTSGSYLAMTLAPGAEPNWTGSTPAFAATAPEGDLAIRLDLAAIVKHFRSDIDAGLGQMEEGLPGGAGLPGGQADQMKAVFGSMMGFARDFVESAETLELSLSMEGNTADLRMGFTAKAGSKLDRPSTAPTELMSLAAHVPDGFPVHMLMHMPWDEVMEWLEPFMDMSLDTVPEEMRAGFQEYMTEAMDMTKLLGSDYAVAFGITDKGIQGVQVATVKDAESYMAKADALLTNKLSAAMPGISVAPGEKTKVAGVDVTTYEMKFDFAKLMDMQGVGGGIGEAEQAKIDQAMERLFGGPGMKMQVAAVENKLVFSMGDMKNLEAVIGSISEGDTKLPSALAQAIDAVGGTPDILLHMDGRTLLRQILGAVRDIADEELPEVPAGGPIPVMFWGGRDGRQYGGGLSVDLGGIAEIVEAMDR